MPRRNTHAHSAGDSLDHNCRRRADAAAGCRSHYGILPARFPDRGRNLARLERIPSPLLLVTPDTEFLIHFPNPPNAFIKIAESIYSRPRQFDTHLLATFPAFGPPAVIAVGEPESTQAKTSTPWLITLMHEHFHQLQDGQPGYYSAVERLGLSGGDKTGMWTLNYPFPYEKAAQGLRRLRDMLLRALNEPDAKEFKRLGAAYVRERKKVFSGLSPHDRKYFSFQLWQEGMARYTQIKVAEAAATYQPSAEYRALPDYEPFAAYAQKARAETLNELEHANLGTMKRGFVYSFGAAEGLLQDRRRPNWKSEYFTHLLSTDFLFQ